MWVENKPEEVKVNGYEIKADKELSRDELDFFESTEIKDPERDKKLQKDLSKEIDTWLSMIKDQAKNILNSYTAWDIPTAEQVQALQILLRISNNAEEQPDTVDDWNDKQKKQSKKVIAINWDSDDLKNVFWWTAESYMSQRSIIEWKFWSKAIALLDNIILGAEKKSDGGKKSADDYIKRSDFDNIIGWKFDKVDGVYNIDPVEAATFLEQQFKSNNSDPREFYENLKNDDSILKENIVASIQSLLWCKQDWILKNIDKNQIKQWQLDHKDDPIFKWYKNKDGSDLSENQIVDWKLWIMTIKALIANWKKLDKTVYDVSDNMNVSWTVDRKDAKEFDIDHDFDKMKTNNKSWLMYSENLNNYWEWWDNWFKFNNWWIDGNWRNFVELNWNRFIEGTKNWKDVDSYTTKREIIRTYVDEDGNEHPVYRDNLSMGRFEDDILAKWQELVLKNWKQIKSMLFDKYKDRGDWQGKSRIWVVRIWDDVDENGDFRGKWRIDLFWEDDTKRLDKEQLQKLDHWDITHILDQAIAAFKETHHKPSEVWRYNLNRIIDRVLSEVWRNGDSRIILRAVADGKDSFSWDWSKARVENFFNLNDWLRSNLDHKIDKDDMTTAEKNVFKGMEKGVEKFEDATENELFNKFKGDELYENKRTPDNFRRWLVWNRIITRLEWLQKAYSVLEPKEDKDIKDDWGDKASEVVQDHIDE